MPKILAAFLLALAPATASAAGSTLTVNCAAGASSCDAAVTPPLATPLMLQLTTGGGEQPPELVDSGPITLSGQSGQTIKGKHIHSTSGACVTVINSSNITLEGNEIGPCGTDKSDAESSGVTIDAKSGGINIYDNYIHVDNQSNGCTKTHVAITVPYGMAGPITVKGNVIAYSERAVWLFKTSNAEVDGNFILNLRKSITCSGGTPNQFPHAVQVWSDPGVILTGVAITNNYHLATAADATVNGQKVKFPGASSDSFSVSYTRDASVSGNYVDLTGAAQENNVQGSSCGALADIGTTGTKLEDNIVSNGYHCGVALASGSNSILRGNKALLLMPSGNSAAAIQLRPDGPGCSNVRVEDNTAFVERPDGYNQAFFSDGLCTNVTYSGNTGGNKLGSGCGPKESCEAYKALYPMATTNPPPKIPPVPHSCLAPSPYSNNTAPPCGSLGQLGGSEAWRQRNPPSK